MILQNESLSPSHGSVTEPRPSPCHHHSPTQYPYHPDSQLGGLNGTRTHGACMHTCTHMHTLRTKTKVRKSITKGFENDLRRNKKTRISRHSNPQNPMRHGGDLGGSDEFEAKRRALKAARDVAEGCRSAARTRCSTRASTLLKFR